MTAKPQQHSPEPWTTGVRHPTRIIGAGRIIARTVELEDESSANDEERATARRIVAAVNACAGIPTEALEAGAVADVLSACGVVAAWAEKARAVLDETGRSNVAAGLTFSGEMRMLRAALAKVGAR